MNGNGNFNTFIPLFTFVINTKNSIVMFCKNCGAEIPDNAVICVKCGVAVTAVDPMKSQCSFVATLLLCFFLGGLGIHRFYVGKTGSGIAMLVMTLLGIIPFIGWLLWIAVGIWVLVDLIMIIVGSFTDCKGLPVKP